MGRILIVDDDPDILKMAEAVLSSEGHTVFVADDALRAMDWLNNFKVDMLLSDANMPVYNGFQLISTLRNDDRFKDMTVAMLTGLRERRDIEKAMKIGVDDYIVKPLDPLILVQKVNSLFEKRPPQQSAEIHLSGNRMNKGFIRHPLTVETVSELGLRILSSVPLSQGQSLDIQCDFFQELQTEVPPMKVLNVETDPISGQFRAQLIFLGAGEAFLQKIRAWLYTHSGSNRTAG